MADSEAPRVPERLISLQHAARLLGVSVRTVRRYVAAGHLEAYRVGPRVLRVSHVQVRALARRLNPED